MRAVKALTGRALASTQFYRQVNCGMPLLAIGDIHGCRKSLETLIHEVNPAAEDRIVFLGDYINRGPDSKGVIDFLINLAKQRQCVFLRGNHEIMTLNAREDDREASGWRLVGGRETLRSYQYWGEEDWRDFIPKSHWEFFEKTQPYYETERHIFVHANLDPNLDMAEQMDSDLFWERFESMKPHKSGKKVICGHTADRDGEIQDVGYATCIDTAAVLGGWLTCLDAETGNYWQANEKESVRRGKISS